MVYIELCLGAIKYNIPHIQVLKRLLCHVTHVYIVSSSPQLLLHQGLGVLGAG